MLAPLSFEEPEQLVRLYQQEPLNPTTRYYRSGAHFTELREHVTSFDGVAALNTYSETGVDLVTGNTARRLRVLQVTSGYFDVLRAGVLRGREFEREVWHGLRLAALGLLAGVALSTLTGRSLAAFLFRVEPLDPVTFVVAGAVIAGAAALAAWVPAVQATRVDPQRVLREQ
jgi:hypothetical protein